MAAAARDGLSRPRERHRVPRNGPLPAEAPRRDGSEDIRFGELGYAREARTSYQDFLARGRGSIATTTRFQVCLPTPDAVIPAFVIPQEIPRVLPAYEAAMMREVGRITQRSRIATWRCSGTSASR